MRVETLGRVDAGLLSRLGGASPSYYLAELERHHVAHRRRGADIRYLVATDEHAIPVGMLPVYTASPPWEPVNDPATVFDPPVPVVEGRLCLAGSAAADTNYLQVGATLPGTEAAMVAHALVERALVVARDAGCPYVLLPQLDEEQSRWLRGYGTVATARATSHKAVLPVEWDSFDAYLDRLPPQRRRSVSRERRAFARSGIDVCDRRLVDVAADLAPLLAQTERKYGRDANREQLEYYLLMLGMHLEDNSLALVGYRNECPVAFSVILVCGDRWFMRCWGCDYASVGREGVYFNVGIYEPIVRAVERGVRQIDFGVGGLEAKTLRGCRSEPLWTILVAPDAHTSHMSGTDVALTGDACAP